MATPNTPPDPEIPDALVQATAREAELDADRVGSFLAHLGLRPSRAGVEVVPLRLPHGLLLGLGAALRLSAWESNGARAHLPVDLPVSGAVIRDLFDAAADPSQAKRLEAHADELILRVFRTWVEYFAWGGRQEMDADLVLGEAEEETLADALADLLWNSRHALDAPPGEEP
jgi:hypothetical protein